MGEPSTSAPAVVREPSLEPSEAEVSLWTCKECYVYQIPPLKNESGHRANDWDVNKWLWSGKLLVVAQGTTVTVRLIDNKTGALFAACPMTEQHNKAIDPVVDSSRYFVLRIDDGKGQHAFIGMGFRDRSDSYDFNATLQDHWKGVQRQREADMIRQNMPEQPMRDLSLKDGEKLNIKVNMPQRSDTAKPTKPRTVAAAFSGGEGLKLAPPPAGGLLAPPPPPAAPPAASPAAQAASTADTTADDDFGGGFDDFKAAGHSGDDDDDDDFGDFAAAAIDTVASEQTIAQTTAAETTIAAETSLSESIG